VKNLACEQQRREINFRFLQINFHFHVPLKKFFLAHILSKDAQKDFQVIESHLAVAVHQFQNLFSAKSHTM
jgi:hypothetical protein